MLSTLTQRWFLLNSEAALIRVMIPHSVFYSNTTSCRGWLLARPSRPSSWRWIVMAGGRYSPRVWVVSHGPAAAASSLHQPTIDSSRSGRWSPVAAMDFLRMPPARVGPAVDFLRHPPACVGPAMDFLRTAGARTGAAMDSRRRPCPTSAPAMSRSSKRELRRSEAMKFVCGSYGGGKDAMASRPEIDP